jgi:hypothetical protein
MAKVVRKNRPSTSSEPVLSLSKERTAKCLNFHFRFPFVVRLSNHERIFSHDLSARGAKS